ncbi:MAG: hypothetical protein KJO75_19820, partial [Dactylosporangium sp.]|nr:hypothetical protein [Dactylosporangium sp.]
GQTASGPASSGADTGREPATAGPRIDSGQSTRAAEPTASSAKTTIVVVDAGSPALIQQRISEIVAGAADR